VNLRFLNLRFLNPRVLNPLDLIYPNFCRACQKLLAQNSVYCSSCSDKIKPVATSFVAVTNKYAIKVFAASVYKDPLRSLILRKAFSDRLASRQLAQIMHEKTNIKNMAFDYIVPIPLHWTRYARRGFNQSYEMASVLSKKLDVPVLDILKRTKRTVFQSTLSHNLRQENVKGVFQVRKKYLDVLRVTLKDKNILLVDDLCTTGATLKNGARQLTDGLPKSISAIVACRVL